MSILDRLNLLIRSNVNDSLGKTGRGPARRALSDMESSLREARRRQAELRRGEKQIVAQIREARDKADQWEDRAMLALRNDDEELAREALIVKNEAMKEAQKLRDQLDDHRAHIQDIERALEALEHKLEGTKNRLQARSRGDQRDRPSQKRIPESGDQWDERLRRRTGATTSGSQDRPSTTRDDGDETFDTSREFQEMDRMANKIDGMEAEIEAMRELGDIGGDGRGAELERKFRSLEGRGRPSGKKRKSSDDDQKKDQRRRSDEPPLDDDLADLKKKFE